MSKRDNILLLKDMYEAASSIAGSGKFSNIYPINRPKLFQLQIGRKFGEKFGGSSEGEEDYGRITEEIRKKLLFGCFWNRKLQWKKSHKE
jgi:hypothetical protein